MICRDQSSLKHHVAQGTATSGDGPFPAKGSAVVRDRGQSSECSSLFAGDGDPVETPWTQASWITATRPRRIAEADRAVVRFNGQQFYDDYVVSDADKRVMREMLAMWDVS